MTVIRPLPTTNRPKETMMMVLSRRGAQAKVSSSRGLLYCRIAPLGTVLRAIFSRASPPTSHASSVPSCKASTSRLAVHIALASPAIHPVTSTSPSSHVSTIFSSPRASTSIPPPRTSLGATGHLTCGTAWLLTASQLRDHSFNELLRKL
jgi:hypothetical protein